MRILLVEDDSLLGEGLHVGLQRENYTVDWVKNGETALSAVRETDYDSMILDIGLPKMSGLQVLKSIRHNGNSIPVLILTAQDGLAERVAGLDTGADDYLAKPFEFDELCARLRALVRRSRGLSSHYISYRNIDIDPAAHTVMLDGDTVDLSRREYSLLETMLVNVGRVLSRTQLEDKLYSWGDEIESNTIEVHIHHLRKRFGADLIKTVRGVGYTIPKEQT
ncbi:MAG: response regulator [Gammaproteobacteria bacterium]|nr:response regulator [Gammaproteobacteria bacterium]